MSTHPADEYVEAFINNADKSKVLSVQNVMIVPKALVRLEDSPEHAIRVMYKNELSTVYVVDSELRLAGILTIGDAINARKDVYKRQASVWSLLIPAMDMSSSMGKLAFLPAAVGFALGMLFLLAMDRLIPHMHLCDEEQEGPKCSLSKSTMPVSYTHLKLPEVFHVLFYSEPECRLWVGRVCMEKDKGAAGSRGSGVRGLSDGSPR